jgi:ABC-type uncharacterized transport system fused permease/ATPase subunit
MVRMMAQEAFRRVASGCTVAFRYGINNIAQFNALLDRIVSSM